MAYRYDGSSKAPVENLNIDIDGSRKRLSSMRIQSAQNPEVTWDSLVEKCRESGTEDHIIILDEDRKNH